MTIGAALAGRTHQHVVPILDHGQDADSDRYFLVMPICEHSLQDAIDREGVLSLGEAKTAALDIVSGLREVDNIVHRDLKPGNVLWHEARWKIADFGIAKFVEDATSLQSLRTSLTPAYAAPEQWRGERPTSATDVYALGCVIYAMLTGRPPFMGDPDGVREAHLHTPAPPLSAGDHRLSGLLATMLRKTPGSRPSLERCATVIAEVQSPVSSGARAALAAAGRAVSQEEAAEEAARSALEAAARERQDLVREATSELQAIIERLFSTVENDTHSARRERDGIALGPARLKFELPTPFFGDLRLPESGRMKTGWEVAANAYLTLKATRGAATNYDPGYYEFSASLVFARLAGDPEFRWRELSFHEVFSQRSNYDQPFALNPFERDFQVAVSNVVGQHQIAHGPLTIDGEDEALFHERWLNLFAKAAARQLSPPNQLPLLPSFFAP